MQGLPASYKNRKNAHDIPLLMMKMMTCTDWSPSTSVKELSALENAAIELSRKTFSNGIWPEGLEPLPSILMMAADTYLQKDLLQEAIKLALNATLSVHRREDFDWPIRMLGVIQMLNVVLKSSVVLAQLNINANISKQDLADLVNGYLGELESKARHIFGLDNSYVKAIQRWLRNERKRAGKPKPGTEAFAEHFEASQSKILKWAGVPEKNAIVLRKDWVKFRAAQLIRQP